MGILDVLLLAVALSMDAFAVSVSDGMACKNIRLQTVLAIAGTFGFFQWLMPTLGYFGSSIFYEQIKAFDHWIAFILLAVLGGKMLFEGIRNLRNSQASGQAETPQRISAKLLLLQGIATSIDALAVGISFAAMRSELRLGVHGSALLIGMTTFFLCVPACFAGKKSGELLSDRAAIAGGLILIGIGIKIFVSHQFFGA